MKKIIFTITVLFLISTNLSSQTLTPQDKYIIDDGGADILGDYIVGLYKKGRFDGIKILEMNNESYMISAGTVTISDYKKLQA